MDWHSKLNHKWRAGQKPFDYNGYSSNSCISLKNGFSICFPNFSSSIKIDFETFKKIAYE